MQDSLVRLQDKIQAALASNTPLRIRGGGSKNFYGQPVDATLPVLDTREHSGIVSYEPSELVITVKAGTPLAEVEAALAEKNQCFPFEPPHFKLPVPQGERNDLPPLPQGEGRGEGQHASNPTIGGKSNKHATIGGMVASGLSGPARATAGCVRDYVLGAHLINGKAEHLQFGGTVMKNVAGYDVSRVLAGSMGTLGLITQVSLKVLPVAPAEATLRFELDEASAIRRCNEWAGQPLPLNASSWVIDQGTPTLYLRLRGAVAAVESACKLFTAQHGCVRVDSPETTADWSAARDLQLPWFEQGLQRGDELWRISVPQTTAPLHLGDTMIDWLGGQRWVFAPTGDAQAAQRITQAAQQADGYALKFIANYAINFAANGQNSPQTMISPVLTKIMRGLKNEFDPLGIFNPGRLGVM